MTEVVEDMMTWALYICVPRDVSLYINDVGVRYASTRAYSLLPFVDLVAFRGLFLLL